MTSHPLTADGSENWQGLTSGRSGEWIKDAIAHEVSESPGMAVHPHAIHSDRPGVGPCLFGKFQAASKLFQHAALSLTIFIACLHPSTLKAQDAPAAKTEEAPELTEAADLAIERGLQYLLATQKPNGSWSNSEGKFEIAATSLGLMAFMVKGDFPGFGRNGAALDRAKDFLLKRSKDSPTGYMDGMYEHGLFTLAMSEMWGMTGKTEDNKEIQYALERAVQVILRAQSPLGGWRYHARPDCGQDTSVTAMVFVSLASARQAGILVPTETIDRVVGYLRDQVWNEQTGGFGYQGNTGSTLSCTAGGAYAAQLCGMRDTEWVQASIRYLENSPKVFNRKEIGYFYYAHYYAMQAMVQAGDEHYAKWYPQIRDALITLQKPDGSWVEKENDYPNNTPMAVIILGTPHRYIPVYQQ